MFKLFKQIWLKLVIEVGLTGLLVLVYYIARHGLPKKWRMQDGTIRKLTKDFTQITSNLANKDDDLGDILAKSKQIFDYFYERRNKSRNITNEFNLFVRDLMEEVDTTKSYTFMKLVFPRIERYADAQETLAELDSMHQVVRYTFSVPHKGEVCAIHVYAIKNFGDDSSSEIASFDQTFAVTKGFPAMTLTNILFAVFDNRLYISAKNSEMLTVEQLAQNTQPDYQVPAKLYDDLLTEIRACRAKSLQRSYILNGPPGTGKTTFCLEMSKQTSGRVLKLDSSTFSNLHSYQSKSIIEALNCDFIIVDDIDRITSSDMPSFLYMLEAIKEYANKPTLLATVNDITELDQAVIRPGRFDDIIEFPLPDVTARKSFIAKMLARNAIKLPVKQLNELATETEGMSHAYLKEYCLQLQLDPNIEKLIKKIRVRKQYIQNMHTTLGADYQPSKEELSEDEDDE